MTTPLRSRSLAIVAIATAIALAGCASAATAPTANPPTAGLPSSGQPSDSAQPGGGQGSDPGGPGGGVPGGGVPGDPGSGGSAPVDPGPVDPGPLDPGPVDPGPVDPGAGEPTIVRPFPGRADPHPVVPIRFETSIDGRHVLVKVSWYGGVEPCAVLDSVRLERSGGSVTVTPIEGSSQQGVACIDIALLKATIVDLGELEPGTYRVSSPGSDAPPAVITIG